MPGLASPAPFPRLSNHGFDKVNDQAIDMWTKFREGKGEHMGENACTIIRDETSDTVSGRKSVKWRGKKKWQSMAGLL